jgi:2-polyprenyl-3-methyl-5-hydroxy-6-metoxy-1,4-benzoquinol methylase
MPKLTPSPVNAAQDAASKGAGAMATTTSTTTTPQAGVVGIDPGSAAEALADRLFVAAVDAVELLNVYLGHTHGLYRRLADDGPVTCNGLADDAGLDRRYLREWLQSQVVAGFVMVAGTDLDTAAFRLAPGGREVLVDETSPTYLAPLAQCATAAAQAVPALVEAFRTGAGVPYASYGPEALSAQAALNRPAYIHLLAAQWVPAIPGLAALLAGPARVADIGCGAGWAAIELAKAYPLVRVDGYDSDDASIALARRNAAEQGLTDRVTFEVRDLREPDTGMPRYDAVLLLECLHDMTYPSLVLRTVRGHLADGAVVIVMDERADETLVAASDDPVQRFLAGISPLWCLPQGVSGPTAQPYGAVFRPAHLREVARQAGFTGVDVLPIDHRFWRFYRLNP